MLNYSRSANSTYPKVGEVFELTLDGDAQENQPMQILRDCGYDDFCHLTDGPKVTGQQTRHFKLVQVGHCHNLDEVKWRLKNEGIIPEGQWIKAFKATYPQPDGQGPVGIADAKWACPDSIPHFPLVIPGGAISFWWANDDKDARWRWLVAVEEAQLAWECRDNMLVRRVKVNHNQTSAEIIGTAIAGRLGRLRDVSDQVLETMPGKGGGVEEIDVYFFQVGRELTVEEVYKEYELRSLVPDHYAQAQVNIEDPTFADKHPNVTLWNREDRIVSYLVFSAGYPLPSSRSVLCKRGDTGWDGSYYWFAGIRKISK